MIEQMIPTEEPLVDSLTQIEAPLHPLIEGPLTSSPWVEELFGRGEWSLEALFRVAERPAINPILNDVGAYGASSWAAYTSITPQPYIEHLTDHPIFQGVVLLLALAYLLMLCANGQELLSLFGRKYHTAGRPSSSGAIYTSVIIGTVMAAALMVRYAEGSPMESYGTMTLLPVSLGLLIFLPLLQSALLLLVGRLTLSGALCEGIIRLKLVATALGALLVMPCALLVVLAPMDSDPIWLYAILLISIGVVLLYLKESFQLFILKKVSILHWFLYLCAVELLPISFIVIKAMRW